MKLENIQQTLLDKQKLAEPEAPSPCLNCPNLDRSTSQSGRIVLSCLLERAESQMPGPRDKSAEKGATSMWVGRALLGEKLDKIHDRGAIDFREKAECAAENCPVIESVTTQLTTANDGDLIDLTPPEPLVSYKDLRIARGLSD